MFVSAPSTNRVIGAADGMMAVVLTAGTLSEVIEVEAAFQSVGGREGRQARSLFNVLCPWAGDGNDDRRGRFPFTGIVGGEPAGFLCKDEPRVEGGKFFSDSEKGVGGRDAVDDKLGRGRVQVDGGGTRDQVEEGGGLRVEGCGLN